MNLTACKYVVVRFYPSLERDEFLNVGVILHTQNQAGQVEARFLQRFGNLRLFVPDRDRPVLGGLKTILKDLELGLEGASKVPHFLDDLVGRFRHHLQFSDVRQALAEDPLTKVEDLYDDFVSVENRERESRAQIGRRQLKARFRSAFEKRGIDVATGDRAVVSGIRIPRHAFDFVQLDSVNSPRCLQTISFDIANIDSAFDTVRAMRGSIDDIVRAGSKAKFWAAMMPPRQLTPVKSSDAGAWQCAADFLRDAGCQVRDLEQQSELHIVDEFART